MKEEDIDRAKQIKYDLVTFRERKRFLEDKDTTVNVSLRDTRNTVVASFNMNEKSYQLGTREVIKTLLLADVNKRIAALESELAAI